MPAPAFRQQTSIANPSSTANTYTSGAMSSAVLVGDLLFCSISAGVTNNALVVSDNVNGSWTRIGNAVSQGSHSGHLFYFAGSAAASAGTLTITVSNGGGSNFGCEMMAYEYTGINPSSPLRNFGQAGIVAGGNQSTGTTPNGVSSLNDGDFIIVGICNNNNNTPTYGAGALTNATGTLTIRNPVTNANAGVEDGVATSAGTSVTATATDGSITWVMGIQAFISAGWQISGSLGASGAGATVSYSGAASGSVTADGSGNFAITGLIAGSYTITPSLTGYTFSPANSSQTIGHADISAVNFTATAAATGGSMLGVSLDSAWRRGGR